MNMKQMWKWLSFLLFIVGLIFAIVAGIWWPDTAWIFGMLAVFGLVIGLIFAISAREMNMLLLASIALIVMSTAFVHITWWDIGLKIGNIIAYFGTMVAPIAIISAIKALVLLGVEK
ncbi:MAG: hypothetical protein ACYDG5_01175 [Dehalococcoidales bacterium]